MSTPALAERGVNVNSIRARLQEIGELVQAKPQVRGQGEITFLFVVLTSADESVFASWGIDNLTFAPVEDTTPAGSSTCPARQVSCRSRLLRRTQTTASAGTAARATV